MTTTSTSRRAARFAAVMFATCLLSASVAGTITAAPSSGQAAGQRTKQLAIFEQLLGETVQEYVSQRLSTMIQTSQPVDPDTGAVAADGDAQLIVKVGMSAPPRGIYIDGYGVIFSIQTPQVAVIPQGLDIRLREPRRIFINPREDGREHALGSTGVIGFRADVIVRSLRELQALMKRAGQESAEPEFNEFHFKELDKLQHVLEDLGNQQGAEVEAGSGQARQDEARAAETRVPEGRANVRRRDPRFEFFEEVVAQRRALPQDFDRSYAVTRQAINDAAIDTLAQYGAVIKGLDGDERLSVLVFPRSRVRFGERADTSSREEYVISVRYGDVRDFDNQKIDSAKFRSRVRIHSRMGTEIELPDRN